MDARRFDSFARGIARLSSRRSLLRGMALAAGGTLTAKAVTYADAEPTGPGPTGTEPAESDGVGGTDGTQITTACPPASTVVCPPSRRPTRRVTAIPPFPAFIIGGACENLDESVTYNLIDAGAEEAEDDTQGADEAVFVTRSFTTIRVRLDDLLAEPHSVVVRAGGTNDAQLVCGAIGGVLTGGSIATGLQERNGSGFAGIAQLTGDDGQTTVNLYVAQDLFELFDSWAGATVVTTIDLNLRAAPSEEAAVIAVLADGSVLTVTGPARGEWLPVENEANGDTGYVSATYVEIQ